MKLKILRNILLKHLNHVIGAVEKKHTKKILENIYISVQNNKMTFLGTDLEIELSSSFEINSGEQGAFTTSASKILGICKALPPESLILLELDKNRLFLKSTRSRFELSTLPANEYPLLDDIHFSDEIILPENILKGLLDATAFSMANQDVRYYLNGLLLEVRDGLIKTVTTDGHRLAIKEYQRGDNNGSDRVKSIIIPRKGVLELSKILNTSCEAPLTLYLSENHIRVEKDNTRFTSKLIDGKYPDYQAAIPAASLYHIELDRLLFRDKLAGVAILSNDKFKGIRLCFSNNIIKLHSTNSEKDVAEDEIDVNYAGEPLEIGFNVTYLLEAINHIDAETIILHISNPDSSVLLSSAENTATKYVVMPIRL
ncbi:MAG: DNA polymerase III subunit beta [Cocleimonas sp.]|nr:DNA polymerase III subunit beta [Cocleimonas sp.]